MTDAPIVVAPPPADLTVVVDAPADQRPARVYLGSLSPGQSRETMARMLARACSMLAPGTEPDVFPWHRLRFQHVAKLRADLVPLMAPKTANLILGGVKGCIRAAVALGQMDADEAHRILISVHGVRGTRAMAGRALTTGELAMLFATLGPRDTALVAVAYGCGLRRAELCALERGHVKPHPDGGLTIDVIGKGNKHRTAHVTGNVQLAVEWWITVVDGANLGPVVPLFLATVKGGGIRNRRLTMAAIYAIMRRCARRAKIARFSPHDLRRTFASDLLDRGADIRTVQALMGHEHVQTTARYDRRPEATRRKASELLHVPLPEKKP